MVSAINNALSGLSLASKTLETSASNIANQFSTSGNQSQQVQPVSQSGAQNQPNDNIVGNDGTDSQGGNDITNDLVGTQIASYDFQANLKVIQASNEMLQSFLNIIT